jgi:hypothetical protein
MDEQTFIITFDDVSAADANRYAEELRQALLDASPDVEVHRRRDDARTQDFGTTLVLFLGTPAAGVLAKALGDWLFRRRIGLTIKTAEGEIIATNITSKDAVKLVDRLFPNK